MGHSEVAQCPCNSWKIYQYSAFLALALTFNTMEWFQPLKNLLELIQPRDQLDNWYIHVQSTRGCVIFPQRLQIPQPQENARLKHPTDRCDIFLVSRCSSRCRRGAAGLPLAQPGSSSAEVRPPCTWTAPGTPNIKFSKQVAWRAISWQLFDITEGQN